MRRGRRGCEGALGRSRGLCFAGWALLFLCFGPVTSAAKLNATNVSSPSLNNTCYDGILVAITGPCGGSHAGRCNRATGSCECFDGWNGASDYLPMDLSEWGGPVLSCPMHTLTIRIMYGLQIPLGLFGILLGFQHLRGTIRIALGKLQRAQGQAPIRRAASIRRVVIDRLAIRGAIMQVVGLILFSGVPILKVANPKYAAFGVHLPVTIVQCLGVFLLSVGLDIEGRTRLRLSLLSRATGEDRAKLRSVVQKTTRRMAVLSVLKACVDLFWVVIAAGVPPTSNWEALELGANRRVVLFIIFEAILGLLVRAEELSEALWRRREFLGMYKMLLSFPHERHIREQITAQRDKAISNAKDEAAFYVVYIFILGPVLCYPALWPLYGYLLPLVTLMVFVTFILTLRREQGQVAVAQAAARTASRASARSTANASSSSSSPSRSSTGWSSVTVPGKDAT